MSPPPPLSVLQASTGGAVCLHLSLAEQDKEPVEKRNGIAIIGAILFVSFSLYFRYKSNQFIKGFCPLKKMSCIGLRPRNMLTLNDTCNLVISWMGVLLLDVLLVNGFKEYKEMFPPRVAFLLHNFSWLLYCEGHNIVLLVYLFRKDFPFVDENTSNSQFYVRPCQTLEPRREIFANSHKYIFKKIWKNKIRLDWEMSHISQGNSPKTVFEKRRTVRYSGFPTVEI